MSVPSERSHLDSGALNHHFIIPSKGSTAIQIRSPLKANNNPKRTPSPQVNGFLTPTTTPESWTAQVVTSPLAQGSTVAVQSPILERHNDPDSGPRSIPPNPKNSGRGSHRPNSSFLPVKDAAETTRLDVHAHSYVPLWLRAVNESVAAPRFCSLLETINFRVYINSFAGGQYLEPVASVKLPPIQDVPVLYSASPELLTPQTYATYFLETLQNEVFAENVELQQSYIFMAALEMQDPRQHLFRLKVPGLRENTPQIALGDILLVRPIFHRSDVPELTHVWYAAGGGKERGLCAPGFAGLEYHAVVWSIARPKEEVILRIDGLMQLNCNIIIALQEHRIAPIARAIAITAESLRVSPSSPVEPDWLSRMLFPTTDEGVMQLALPKGTFPHMKWFDSDLNYEQQKAINAVFDSNYGNIPYLISGPPGTGKTKTIVETTLQLLRRSQHQAENHDRADPTPHILLCAPSDPAADTLASRLASELTPAELFRLNGSSRSFAEVPGLLLPYSYVDKDLFSLPSFETLMSYKVVVTTCRDSDMLVQARLTNQDLSYLTRSTLRVVAPGAYTAISESQLLHWTALLIDEAAQATEPEVLIPLTVIAPALDDRTGSQGQQSLPQVIMAGDEHQLGPRLFSSSTSALSTSLFARLLSRAIYAEHPLSRQGGSQRLIASMLPMKRPPFTHLVRNYRSHPSIISVPSQLFYSDTLIPECTALSDILRTWPGWKSPHRWPVLFVQNTTSDDVESVLSGNGTGAGALFNHGEVTNALQHVLGLLEHRVPYHEAAGRIRQDEIAVISPFKAQVHLLRKIFRESGLHDVNIGPLEAFQGLESRVVVLCTTRTRRGAEEGKAGRFVQEDRERGLGVIGEPKRFNVAITRAKEGLIVLGDPETLTVGGDPCWKAFISFCARNGCLIPEHQREPSDLRWVERFKQVEGFKQGRLERALLFAADVKLREIRREEQKGFGYPDSPETRRRKRFALKGQMLTTDDEMWKAGLQMVEEMDESTGPQDRDADQPAEDGTDGEPDLWNRDRDLAGGTEHAHGQEHLTRCTENSIASFTADTGREPVENDDILKSSGATEYDRDPKAEFERTDCATQ